MEGYVSSGTVTDHYISFLKMTLNVMDKHPHTYHCYVDTPPSSPRIANTVISNYEAINCRQTQKKIMTTTCQRNGTQFFYGGQ